MLTGSLVSSYYGDPRSTRNLDLVVNATEPPDDRVRKFVDLCEREGFYVATEVTEAALGPWRSSSEALWLPSLRHGASIAVS
jgi:hypothetical protein